MNVFECRVRGGRLAADGVETLEARFVSEAELAGLPLARWAHAVLPAVFRRGDHPGFTAPSWRS